MKRTLKFYYFENHGNEDGTNNFTIIHGDQEGEFGEGVITGAEDTEEDAIEACKRLNEISDSLKVELTEAKRLLEGIVWTLNEVEPSINKDQPYVKLAKQFLLNGITTL